MEFGYDAGNRMTLLKQIVSVPKSLFQETAANPVRKSVATFTFSYPDDVRFACSSSSMMLPARVQLDCLVHISIS